jgi:hypothetical protein
MGLLEARLEEDFNMVLIFAIERKYRTLQIWIDLDQTPGSIKFAHRNTE